METDEEIKQVFAVFDLNGNGKISHNEMKIIFDKLGLGYSSMEIKKIIAVYDTNKDGEIDFEEFKQIMKLKLF